MSKYHQSESEQQLKNWAEAIMKAKPEIKSAEDLKRITANIYKKQETS